MSLYEIIRIAEAAYPDGLIGRYFPEPSKNHGDTLAKFITAELKDTFDPEASDAQQLLEALRVLTVAANQLEEVRHALDSRYRELVGRAAHQS
jgi:hypothetical protein